MFTRLVVNILVKKFRSSLYAATQSPLLYCIPVPFLHLFIQYDKRGEKYITQGCCIRRNVPDLPYILHRSTANRKCIMGTYNIRLIYA